MLRAGYDLSEDQGQRADASPYAVDRLITEARRLAADYRRATGKPLPGISTEIALSDAVRLLDLERVDDPAAGYDALGRGDRAGRRIQVKARAIFGELRSSHRVGQLRLDREWDSVVLVLMDADYEPFAIYEADRDRILAAIAEGQSGQRARRGALSVARFRHIGRLVWSREAPAPDGADG